MDLRHAARQLVLLALLDHNGLGAEQGDACSLLLHVVFELRDLRAAMAEGGCHSALNAVDALQCTALLRKSIELVFLLGVFRFVHLVVVVCAVGAGAVCAVAMHGDKTGVVAIAVSSITAVIIIIRIVSVSFTHIVIDGDSLDRRRGRCGFSRLGSCALDQRLVQVLCEGEKKNKKNKKKTKNLNT